MAKKQSKIKPRIVDYFPNMWLPDWECPPFNPDTFFLESDPFLKFWRKAMNVLREGIVIDGIKIHGWLIFDTVMWRIELDQETKGRSFKTEGIPDFRDIEYITNEDLIRAEHEKRGWLIMGSRGTGKSNLASSIGGYYYSCYHDLEVIVSAGGAPDLAPLCAKIDYGLTRLDNRTLSKHRNMDNWRSEVRAGYKDPDGKRYGSNSRFQIRNFDDGSNTMACNGLRGKIHLFEEIGKLKTFKTCYNDSNMCWMNDYGQFGIPIGLGTGGDTDFGADSKEVFLDPRTYNLLEFPDVFEGRKKPIGRFFPVTMARNEYKEDWTFYRYLTEKLHYDIPEKHDKRLDNIIIKVSNEEKCLREFVTPRRDIARQSTDPTKLTKEVAYYCLTPSESFTIIGQNKFPVEALRKHQQWLIEEEVRGMNVKLFHLANGNVDWVESADVHPVIDYPLTSSSIREGCIVIYEPPEKDAPPFTYIGGADPYNQHQAPTSDSIGGFYIYKRIITVTGTMQRRIVASYNGRPATMNDWHEGVNMLMHLYSATTLPENEGSTFTQYFDGINEGYMLADVFDFRKEVSPGSKVDRSKGLPATLPYISFCMNLVYDYVNEKLIIGYRINPISKLEEPIIQMGYTRIPDPLLLEEMCQYDGIKNTDRLVAFRHVLAYEKSLEKYGNDYSQTQEETKTNDYSTHIKTPFYIPPRKNGNSQGKRTVSSPFYSVKTR